MAEWWLRPTTSDQCGQNPGMYLVQIHFWSSKEKVSFFSVFFSRSTKFPKEQKHKKIVIL